jgi:hypothetical protein
MGIHCSGFILSWIPPVRTVHSLKEGEKRRKRN